MTKKDGHGFRIKLLVDKHSKRVLFAEAGKDFVDFLFHIMTMPVGTLIRLLKNNDVVGCVGNLYRSIRNISDVYMESASKKEALLKPKSPSYGASFSHPLPDSSPSASNTYYRCMDEGTSSGYVKGVVTYMVKDNLEVEPMSTISCITILNQFDIKDVRALEEKVIDVGMKEALKLLKTSLYSKSVLTDVFFGKV